MRRIASLALSAMLVWVGPAMSQTTPAVVTSGELEQALLRHADREGESRSRVIGLLQRDDVRAMAQEAGLDLRRAEAAVGTLEPTELEDLAQQAASIESGLAGGDTVIRISLVALLLIIIIIILLAD